MQMNGDAIGFTTPAVLGAQMADPNGRHIHLIGDGASVLDKFMGIQE